MPFGIDRAAQRERLLTKLGEPYQNWTFCLALQDAQAYERAGTLNAALAEIAATASAARRANEAAAELKAGDFDWKQIFGAGVRWFHSGGIFASLSKTTGEVING